MNRVPEQPAAIPYYKPYRSIDLAYARSLVVERVALCFARIKEWFILIFSRIRSYFYGNPEQRPAALAPLVQPLSPFNSRDFIQCFSLYFPLKETAGLNRYWRNCVGSSESLVLRARKIKDKTAVHILAHRYIRLLFSNPPEAQRFVGAYLNRLPSDQKRDLLSELALKGQLLGGALVPVSREYLKYMSLTCRPYEIIDDDHPDTVFVQEEYGPYRIGHCFRLIATYRDLNRYLLQGASLRTNLFAGLFGSYREPLLDQFLKQLPDEATELILYSRDDDYNTYTYNRKAPYTVLGKTLQRLRHLEVFHCSCWSDNVPDFRMLRNCRNLRDIAIGPVTDQVLEALADCNALEKVDFINMEDVTAPVSCERFTRNKQFKQLYLSWISEISLQALLMNRAALVGLEEADLTVMSQPRALIRDGVKTLSALSSCQKLRILTIRSSIVFRGENSDLLTRCISLTTLSLREVQGNLQNIGCPPALETLTFALNNNYASLSHLPRLPELRSLHVTLYPPQLSAAAGVFIHFAQIRKLEILHLSFYSYAQAEAANVAMTYLSECENLNTLTLKGMPISDQNLLLFHKNPQLRVLRLPGYNQCTIAGIRALSEKAPQLKELEIKLSFSISEDELTHLRQTYPNIEFRLD